MRISDWSSDVCSSDLHDGDLAIITLNRPEALNALSFTVLKEIGEAIDRAAALNIRALVFTGAGEKAFCAGADIKALMGRTVMEERAGAQLGQSTFAKQIGRAHV